MLSNHYKGNELELFQEARHWKNYWLQKIRPYIRGRVLEVGAGMGTNSKLLLKVQTITSLETIEPDETLVEKAVDSLKDFSNLSIITIRKGQLENLRAEEKFDTIIYIDVLEHIEADKQELVTASKHLAEGGHLIVLSPAFQFLFSEFDRSIGHLRRYRKASFTRLRPPGLSITKLFYLDAVGFFASLANRLVLKQSYPSIQQIRFWDSYFLPISKLFDPLLGNLFGRSIVGIWKKQSS